MMPPGTVPPTPAPTPEPRPKPPPAPAAPVRPADVPAAPTPEPTPVPKLVPVPMPVLRPVPCCPVAVPVPAAPRPAPPAPGHLAARNAGVGLHRRPGQELEVAAGDGVLVLLPQVAVVEEHFDAGRQRVGELALIEGDRPRVLLAAEDQLGFLLTPGRRVPDRERDGHHHRHHAHGDEERRHRVAAAPRSAGLTAGARRRRRRIRAWVDPDGAAAYGKSAVTTSAWAETAVPFANRTVTVAVNTFSSCV